MNPIYFAMPLAIMSNVAAADLRVSFTEGAPKDRFTFTQMGDCDLNEGVIELQLAGSSGRLIFDVTNAGAGVQVFQPFELAQGAELLSSEPSVVDGQTALVLPINELPSGRSIAFTIDVDDTVGQREITVSGAEIVGATVSFDDGSGQQTGTFDKTSTATIDIRDCGP